VCFVNTIQSCELNQMDLTIARNGSVPALGLIGRCQLVPADTPITTLA